MDAGVGGQAHHPGDVGAVGISGKEVRATEVERDKTGIPVDDVEVKFAPQVAFPRRFGLGRVGVIIEVRRPLDALRGEDSESPGLDPGKTGRQAGVGR